MLRGFDANKDGVIDPSEVPEDRRRFLGFIGSRMGVDFSKAVVIDKLRDKVSEEFGGKKKKEPEPLVPGFGVPQEEGTVLAFGQRPAEATSAAGRSSSRGGSGGEQDERAQGFAEMMMRRYDRDGNGVLERDKGEWEGVRGDPNEIDRNHDGRIDRDEMVARVASYMGGNRGGDQGDDRGGDRGDRGGGRDRDQGADGKEGSKESRKSYRFLSATERLPEGLPSWFSERDGNKDGQVTMAEYSSSWDDSKAREYLRYDLNDDGIVTPGECLASLSATSTQTPPPPGSPPAPAGPPAPGGPPASAGPAATADGTSPPPATGTPPAEKKEATPAPAKPWWM